MISLEPPFLNEISEDSIVESNSELDDSCNSEISCDDYESALNKYLGKAFFINLWVI